MKNRISELYEKKDSLNKKADYFLIKPDTKNPFELDKKKRVHILALGDVGGMVLMGLRLLGANAIHTIGIYDMNPKMAARYEMEAGQVAYPLGQGLPAVEVIEEKDLFQCDMMVFCASKGVPNVGEKTTDVRMVQLKENASLVSHFAQKAAADKFEGLFAVVSDPVDPLCKAAYLQGLAREQVQGFGLGVMNARALYFSQKDLRFSAFLEEGRVFGPHGQDLVVANSLEHYDAQLSLELTKLTIESNVRTRELGFKPYMAPALSSGAISLIAVLEGHWNYSSVYFGNGGKGAFLGIKNRRTPYGIQVEDLPLEEPLFLRIKQAYENLSKLM